MHVTQVHVYVRPDTFAALRRRRPEATTADLAREALTALAETVEHARDYPAASRLLGRITPAMVHETEREGVRVSFGDRRGLLARVGGWYGTNADTLRVALAHLADLLEAAEAEERDGIGAWAA